VPKNRFGDENYDGGTRSFRLRYGRQMKPFKLSECREGDVAFVDFQTPWAPEGHIGFCLGNGPNAKYLQSHLATSCVTGEPGLNNATSRSLRAIMVATILTASRGRRSGVK
jgi:hypothetical protein